MAYNNNYHKHNYKDIIWTGDQTKNPVLVPPKYHSDYDTFAGFKGNPKDIFICNTPIHNHNIINKLNYIDYLTHRQVKLIPLSERVNDCFDNKIEAFIPLTDTNTNYYFCYICLYVCIFLIIKICYN